MFLSVRERARQIALGQFTAPTTSTPLVDLASEPVPAPAPPRKTGAKETTQEVAAESKGAPTKEPTPKAAPPQKPPAKAAPPKATTAPASKPTSSKTNPTSPEAPTPKKPSLRSKLTKEPPTPTTEAPRPKRSSKSKITKEPSSPKPSPSKTHKEPPSPKFSSYMSPWTSSAKPPPSPKPESQKSKSSATSKSRRAKSPPKRVDSPLASLDDEDDDPLSALKSASLKQISAVPGLGSRQLVVVLKQRSSGEWYAALKDTGADKYLKSWMNREKTFKTRREALEAYLGFATKMREKSAGSGMGWFPMSPRTSSPKGKGR
ncbi:hypothetical protein PMIN03_002249 [Paraphaeosphaeria minitans]|uniref:Uncharacterized protein n=1 Tax=Paraphaeosphaeria minitans TaxID=565426 RepID=A0A9P6KQH3_9PLEO|nr:hypothetical protein PMIN01_05688 [Paraphaeosphaeria minitans]